VQAEVRRALRLVRNAEAVGAQVGQGLGQQEDDLVVRVRVQDVGSGRRQVPDDRPRQLLVARPEIVPLLVEPREALGPHLRQDGAARPGGFSPRYGSGAAR
jgi:hypothetical protein